MTRFTPTTLFLTVLALSQFAPGQAQEYIYAREAADGSELAARGFWQTVDKGALDVGKIGKQAIGMLGSMPKRDLEAREAGFWRTVDKGALDVGKIGKQAIGMLGSMPKRDLEAREAGFWHTVDKGALDVGKIGKQAIGMLSSMPKRDLEARETGLAARDIHDELLEARANKAGQFFKHAANVVGNYEKGFWGLKRDLGERDMGDDMLEARANKAGQFVKNVAGAAGNYEKGFWGLRHDLGERDLGNDMLEPRANKAVQFFKTSPGVGNYEKGFRGLRRDLGERGVTAAQAAQAQMANQKAMQAADMRMQSSMANNNMLHTQKAHVARDLEFEERDLDDGLYERDFDGFEERDLEDFEGLEY